MVTGRVSNLSQSGLSVRCNEVDPLGTTAQIDLELPSQDDPITLSGRVVWVTSDSDRGSTMGIGFDELPKASALALANFVLRSSQTRSS